MLAAFVLWISGPKVYCAITWAASIEPKPVINVRKGKRFLMHVFIGWFHRLKQFPRAR